MIRTLTTLALASAASAGVVHPIPDPYRWDESFEVEMPQMDDEHRGLFNGIMMLEANNIQKEFDKLNVKFDDYFSLEESYFKQTMSDEYVADHLNKHATFMTRFQASMMPVPASEVTWAKNWLVQHIKNTDFKYVGVVVGSSGLQDFSVSPFWVYWDWNWFGLGLGGLGLNGWGLGLDNYILQCNQSVIWRGSLES